MPEWTEEQRRVALKAMHVLVGILDELRSDGLIDGGTTKLSVKGRAIWDQLWAEGVRPEPAELSSMLASLQVPSESLKLFSTLVQDWMRRHAR